MRFLRCAAAAVILLASAPASIVAQPTAPLAQPPRGSGTYVELLSLHDELRA